MAYIKAIDLHMKAKEYLNKKEIWESLELNQRAIIECVKGINKEIKRNELISDIIIYLEFMTLKERTENRNIENKYMYVLNLAKNASKYL